MRPAPSFTEHSIVNYGVSEHLKAEFDMLRDVPSNRTGKTKASDRDDHGDRDNNGTNGQSKFTRKTVDTLAQHIVCRHYGNLCYEFSHLNWALILVNTGGNSTSNITQSLLDFYWISQCNSAGKFAAYFNDRVLHDRAFNDHTFNDRDFSGCSAQPPAKPAMSVVCVGSAEVCEASNSQAPLLGITLSIYDHTFTISANRANLLACFMEWLVCVVPNLLNLIETSLLRKGHNAIREFSSLLQKHIYDYLAQHLPPAKLQLRYRLMQSWFQDHSNLSRSEITDDSILAFWQKHNTQEGYGKFSSVVKDILSYQQALDVTQAGAYVQFAQSNNEIAEKQATSTVSNQDDDSLFTFMAKQHSAHTINAEALANKPKVLNKQQLELLEVAAQYPRYILPLSMTWLRLQVFGKTQHQIIQLVRMNRLYISSADDYSAICEQNYDKIKYNCAALMATNQQALLAIVDIIMRDSPSQACLILLKLMPTLPKFNIYVNEFAQILDDCVHQECLQKKNEYTNNFCEATLRQRESNTAWLKDLFRQCRLAHKQINREGFTPTTLLESQHYVNSAEHLFDINKMLKQLVTHMNKNLQCTELKFEADRLIFNSAFNSLYSNGNN